MARGTKSWMAGLRPSVRFPKRMVPSWVSDPMGLPRPRLMASRPAMNVVVTAPMPGIRTPSLPSAGAIWTLSELGKHGFSSRSKCYNTNSMRERATATLTTLVVDDEQLACDELSFLLRDFPEIEVIATGSNGLEAVNLVRELEPELCFLDVHMPGLDGMGVVRQLREKQRRAAPFHLRDRLRPVCRGGLPPGGHGLPAEAGGQGPPGRNHRARQPDDPGDANRPSLPAPKAATPRSAPSCWCAPTAAISSWTPTT